MRVAVPFPRIKSADIPARRIADDCPEDEAGKSRAGITRPKRG